MEHSLSVCTLLLTFSSDMTKVSNLGVYCHHHLQPPGHPMISESVVSFSCCLYCLSIIILALARPLATATILNLVHIRLLYALYTTANIYSQVYKLFACNFRLAVLSAVTSCKVPPAPVYSAPSGYRKAS